MNDHEKENSSRVNNADINVQNEVPVDSAKAKIWHQIIASGTGAILTSIFMTPLDVVKIRLQVQAKPLAKTDGCPCNRPLLHTYDQLRIHFLQKFSHENRIYAPVLAGGISRVFAVSIINPLELIRTNMQSKPLSYAELVSCIRTAVEVDGFVSLWRGLGPTLLRDVPFSAIHWFFYDYFRTKLHKYLDRDIPTFSGAFICGALSGTIASIMTQPFDVVKTQRQVELGDRTSMR
ncbi:putative solute carrier family 25 member 39 isoform X12, partial [Apostichopus japonicus]